MPLDRAIASELYELALRQEGENWIGETIDGRSFSAPEDYDNPWVIPDRGILELRYFSTPLPPSLEDVVSAEHIEQIISHVSTQAGSDNSNTVSNDKAGRDLLLSHAKEHVFNCSQVVLLLAPARDYLNLTCRFAGSGPLKNYFGADGTSSSRH